MLSKAGKKGCNFKLTTSFLRGCPFRRQPHVFPALPGDGRPGGSRSQPAPPSPTPRGLAAPAAGLRCRRRREQWPGPGPGRRGLRTPPGRAARARPARERGFRPGNSQAAPSSPAGAPPSPRGSHGGAGEPEKRESGRKKKNKGKIALSARRAVFRYCPDYCCYYLGNKGELCP